MMQSAKNHELNCVHSCQSCAPKYPSQHAMRLQANKNESRVDAVPGATQPRSANRAALVS